LATELLVNSTSAVVISGGTDAPAAGTVETWVVAALNGFPVLSAGQQFRCVDVADPNALAGSIGTPEVFLVTAMSGAGNLTWTVTRGSEYNSSTGLGNTVVHAANFVVVPVFTSGSLPTAFTERVNNLSDVFDTGSSRGNLHIPSLTPAAALSILPVSLSAPGATFDGYSASSGDLILLINQTVGSQNGLWTWNGASTLMTRPTEFASGTSVKGRTCAVLQGNNYGSSEWLLNAPTAGITVDTTTQTWIQAAQGQFNYIGSNGAYDDKPGLVALEALIQATPFGAGTIHKHGLVTLGSSWAAPQGIMPEGDGVGYDNGNQSWNGGTVVAPYSTFTGGPGPLITYTLSGSNTGSCKHIGFSGVPLAATGGTSTPGMTGVMISGGADFFFEDVCFAGFDTGGVGAGGVMGGGILANNHVGGRVLKCFTASNGYGIALTGTSTDWAISMHKGNGNNISLIQGVGVQADNCGGLLIDECHYTGSGNITTATANLCLMASVQSEAVTGVITSDTLTLYSNTVFAGTVTVTINGTPVSFGFNASGATIETAINAALGAGTVTANAGGPLHTASCLVSGGTTTTPTLTNNGATTTVAVAINGVLVTFAYNASGATIAAAINAALGAGTVTGSSGADLATGAVGLTFAVAPSSFVVLGQPVVLTFAVAPTTFVGFYAQAVPTLPYHWYLGGTASDVAYATNMYFDNCDPNGFHIYTECTGLTIASGKFLMRDNSTANCFIQTNTGVGNINPGLMLGDGVQFSGIGNGCAAVALVQFMEQAGQPAYVTIGHVRAIFASTYTPNTDTVTMTVGSNFIGDASASAAYVNSPVVQTNAFAYPGAYVIAYQASPQGILVSQVVTTAETSLTVFPFNAYIDSAGNPVQPFEHAGGRLKLPVYGGL